MTFRFGEHISLDLPKTVSIENDDFGNTAAQITSKAVIKVAERIDDAIINEIVAMARSEGIDDIYLLDKKNIISALSKQIPKKPIDNRYPWCICPVCGGSVYLKNVQEHIMNLENTHCEHCGQALDWGDANDT